jgi:hypothetical protein
VELKPFRSLRYSPRVLFERGLSALIAAPAGAPGTPEPLSPENVLHVVLPPRGSAGRGAAAAQTLKGWIENGIVLRERRPGLWLYRQTIPGTPAPAIVSFLVGLVRLAAAGDASVPAREPADPRSPEERLALRRETRADFEPCLLVTRAPLSGALSTTRPADLSAEGHSGVRHDAYRVHDYAQHVELQGLLSGAEIVLAAGRPLWETARAFETDPAAEKLPGAKFKLCAIVEEGSLRERRDLFPEVVLGFFGVSLEDPVY